ncbi:TLR21 protein, partial [Crypturellus soui]|nr:TLR21 protein [Crypturellus soui]
TWRVWAIYIILMTRLSEEQDLKQVCPSCDATPFCNCSSRGLSFIPPGLTDKTTGLNLAHNRIELIRARDLQHAVNLRVLLLSANEISSIEEDSFRSLAKLELLDLSNNSLSHLSPAWFGHLFSLQHLNIQGNFYRDLGESSLFSNLRNLSSLYLGNRQFSTIREGNFEGISLLNELWIDGGNLSRYEPGSLKSVRQIDHMIINVKSVDVFSVIVEDLLHSVVWLEVREIKLDIKKESLTENSTLPFMMQKVTFKDVIFTDQYISRVMVVFKKIRSLRELEIIDCVLEGEGHWNISEIVNSGPSSVETISITNITIPYFHLFSDLRGVGSQVKDLKRLRISGSRVFMVPCELTRHFLSLLYLDFQDNLLVNNRLTETTCKGGWPLLQTLNLSQNSLKSLEETAKNLNHLSKLVNLDLSQNKFGVIPDICQWPDKLKHLNLSSTQIPKLTTCIPVTLEVLDVSANNLQEFGLQLPFLKELYIARNQLKTLADVAPLPSLVAMSIRRNKLNSISKEELEGQQVGAVRLSLMECHRSLLVSLVCVVVFLLILALVVVGYKYHVIWYVRMTWAWLRAKRKPRPGPPKDICYDAFVSYSENDSEWVENIMVQELEQACPPFRLCLHKRDFVPGKWIVDNIIDSIEKSHKTLFVLSEHFVQSEWCKYELDFSHFRLFDENNDAAILILLEPIQGKDIPKRFCKLRKIMNTKTYLEWPAGEEQQQIFWKNLKAALKS